MNILVVDDDRPCHADIRSRLTRSPLGNNRVFSAYSLREALAQLVSSSKMDFFIVEYCFTDGREAAWPLIQQMNSRSRKIPGAVMTRTSPAGMPHELVDLFSRGQVTYLEKNEANSQAIDQIVTRTGLRPLDILFVDDDPDDVELVTSGLELRCGTRFRLDVATSIQEALEKNSQRAYHGYIIDYMLRPGVGPDFYLKLPEAHRKRPAVLMTGSSQLSQLPGNLRAMGKDSLHFISKRGLDFAHLAELLIYDRPLRSR